MAAFALCSREAMYSNMNSANPTAQRSGVAPQSNTANSRKPRKNSKWKPFDLHADERNPGDKSIDNNWNLTWAEPSASAREAGARGVPSTASTHPNKIHHPPPQPPKRKQRRQQKMASNKGNNREYIPPHLRNPRNRPGGYVLSVPVAPKGPKEKDGTSNVQNNATPETQASRPVGTVSPVAGAPKGPKVPNGASKDQNGATPEAQPKAAPSAPSFSPAVGKMAHRAYPHRPRWTRHQQPQQPQQSQQPRKTRWPKNRDMKPQPIDEWSDGGVSFESHSNGDPDYDVKKLMDWNGGWLPAPVEWSSRKSFTDRNLSQHIDQWAKQVANAYGGSLEQYGLMDTRSSPYHGVWSTWGELAPRNWIPTQVEGDSLRQFWRSLPSRAPAPMSDIDLSEAQPWWDLYTDEGHDFLPHLDVPDARIDPDEFENNRPGVKVSSHDACLRKHRTDQARIRKTLERRNRPCNPIPDVEVLDTSLKPTANIYLRPVVPADAPQITAIYNHYIKETVSANEFNDRTRSHMVDRINDIAARGLPWIVAVQRKNGQQQSPFVIENIVGFANMDDYCDAGSMYRFTFELEMYVHSDHIHQGIGKCMLDQMLSMTHTGYMAKGGYDWVCPSEYLKNGCARVVKVMNFTFPHATDESEKLECVTKLLKNFGFRKAGHLHGLGYKYGKCVDVSLFQITTTEPINAAQPPVNPL